MHIIYIYPFSNPDSMRNTLCDIQAPGRNVKSTVLVYTIRSHILCEGFRKMTQHVELLLI